MKAVIGWGKKEERVTIKFHGSKELRDGGQNVIAFQLIGTVISLDFSNLTISHWAWLQAVTIRNPLATCNLLFSVLLSEKRTRPRSIGTAFGWNCPVKENRLDVKSTDGEQIVWKDPKHKKNKLRLATTCQRHVKYSLCQLEMIRLVVIDVNTACGCFETCVCGGGDRIGKKTSTHARTHTHTHTPYHSTIEYAGKGCGVG